MDIIIREVDEEEMVGILYFSANNSGVNNEWL
jgi:hypothetical protein